MRSAPPTAADRAAVGTQLGRPPRGSWLVAHRCECGLPDVVATAPRLADGTPFPTLYYLTCPRAVAAVSRLESTGWMATATARLAADRGYAAGYRAAHADYLRRRAELGEVGEIAGVSAGGMPDRVKCVHAVVAHALAAGPGVNPVGDDALAVLPRWGRAGPCVQPVGSDPPGASDQAGTAGDGTAGDGTAGASGGGVAGVR